MNDDVWDVVPYDPVAIPACTVGMTNAVVQIMHRDGIWHGSGTARLECDLLNEIPGLHIRDVDLMVSAGVLCRSMNEFHESSVALVDVQEFSRDWQLEFTQPRLLCLMPLHNFQKAAKVEIVTHLIASGWTPTLALANGEHLRDGPLEFSSGMMAACDMPRCPNIPKPFLFPTIDCTNTMAALPLLLLVRTACSDPDGERQVEGYHFVVIVSDGGVGKHLVVFAPLGKSPRQRVHCTLFVWQRSTSCGLALCHGCVHSCQTDTTVAAWS